MLRYQFRTSALAIFDGQSPRDGSLNDPLLHSVVTEIQWPLPKALSGKLCSEGAGTTRVSEIACAWRSNHYCGSEIYCFVSLQSIIRPIEGPDLWIAALAELPCTTLNAKSSITMCPRLVFLSLCIPRTDIHLVQLMYMLHSVSMSGERTVEAELQF